MNLDGLHHRAPAADHGAVGAHHRPAARDDRDVGRRAAHVGDREVILTREKARADDARGRPRQYRLDRILERHLGAHQRAIALGHHHRCCNPLLPEHAAQRLEEPGDLWRKARVERGSQRAPRRIEMGAELVAARHGLAARGADQFAHALLVRDVSDREHRRHRKCLDLGAVLAHRRRDCGLIERLGLLPGGVMATAYPHHHASGGAPKA